MINTRIGRRALAQATKAVCIMATTLRQAPAQDGLPQSALSLPRPQEAPLLTISGKIQNTNARDTALFDRPMLQQLGSATVTTNTPWYDGPVRFDGVLMTHLMQAVGASGEMVTALAVNDYSTDIPIEDFARFGVLLAMLRNGLPMRVKDKGPLFIVYPYDSSPELRARLYYSRSAWSVVQLIVR